MYFGGSCKNASSSAKTSLLQTRGASRDIATSMLMEAALNCSAAGGRVLFITHRLAAFPTLPSSVTLSSGGGGEAEKSSSPARRRRGAATDVQLECVHMKYVKSHDGLLFLLANAHAFSPPYNLVLLDDLSSFFPPPHDAGPTRAALLRAVALALSVARHFGDVATSVGSRCSAAGTGAAGAAATASCHLIVSDPGFVRDGGGGTTPNPNASMLERLFELVLVATRVERGAGAFAMHARPTGRAASMNTDALVFHYSRSAPS